MAPIGQELKRERELRGISLKEIADATKVNLRFLRILEEDQLDELPGKFFTIGIIRSYAKYIGLEESAALNNYYETIQLLEESKEEEEEKKETQTVMPKKIKNLIYFISIFIICIGILSIIHFILQKRGGSPLKKSQSETVVLQETPLPPPTVEAIEEEKELNLKISFHQETWIQVYADGELKINGIKQSGDQIQVKALQELLIHLGNAGGLTYTLNNKKGKSLGPSGGVARNIKITLDNLEEFIEINGTNDG